MSLYDEKVAEARVALITACGSPGGTGYWTARHLVADGFNVIVLASRDFEGAQACCSAVRDAVAAGGNTSRNLKVLPLRLSGADRTHHAEVRAARRSPGADIAQALRVLTDELHVQHLDGASRQSIGRARL